MITIKNILVPTDFRPASANALRYGRALAGQFGARLHVLHVTHSLYATAAINYGYGGVPFEAQAEFDRTARTQTEALLTDEDRHALRATAVTFPDNSPALAVADYAWSHDIDLVIVGTHGRGALARLVMGGVAERVVRMARCPVLTVSDPEDLFVASAADREGAARFSPPVVNLPRPRVIAREKV